MFREKPKVFKPFCWVSFLNPTYNATTLIFKGVPAIDKIFFITISVGEPKLLVGCVATHPRDRLEATYPTGRLTTRALLAFISSLATAIAPLCCRKIEDATSYRYHQPEGDKNQNTQYRSFHSTLKAVTTPNYHCNRPSEQNQQ